MISMESKIIHGDCVDILKSIAGGSVDLVFADPPFNIGLKGYDGYSDTLTPTQYLDWSEKWIVECFRVLKKNGSMYVVIGDEFMAEIAVILKKYFTWRNNIVWHYGFGQNQKKKFSRCHTNLLYFVKSGKDFCWNGDEIKVPSKRQEKYGDKRAKKGGKIPEDIFDIFSEEQEDTKYEVLVGKGGVQSNFRPLIDSSRIPEGLSVHCKGGLINGKTTHLYMTDRDHRGFHPIPAGLIRGTDNWPEWKMNFLRTVLSSGVDVESAVEQVERADPTKDGSWLARETAVEVLEENYSDFWKISRLAGTFNERIKDSDGSTHPCQLPRELVDRVIKVSSNVGDLVVDPFAGTGTTAESAVALGRKFITMDRSEKYCRVVAKRVYGDESRFEKFTLPLSEQMEMF